MKRIVLLTREITRELTRVFESKLVAQMLNGMPYLQERLVKLYNSREFYHLSKILDIYMSQKYMQYFRYVQAQMCQSCLEVFRINQASTLSFVLDSWSKIVDNWTSNLGGLQHLTVKPSPNFCDLTVHKSLFGSRQNHDVRPGGPFKKESCSRSV